MCFYIIESYGQDSIINKHYRASFSFQTNYSSASLNYKVSSGYTYEYKQGYNYESSIFNEKVISENTFNPELKADFELPLWLKITCGINYSKLKIATDYRERNYTEVHDLYDPNSTPWNIIVVGTSSHTTLMGYNKHFSELEYIGTFIGLGFSKQYKRFNFDVDYSVAAKKAISAYVTVKYFDTNYSYQKTEGYNGLESYNGIKDLPIFVHQFSTNVSYRFCKKVSVKLGAQYSKNDNDLIYDKISLKRVNYFSFILGLTFSII